MYPDYRGSHFVRDPRDLIVSGYHYHLWTGEPWCIAPDFDWRRIVNHPFFKEYVAGDDKRAPQRISYRDYLNTLDKEKGMIVEMLWRQHHFEHVRNWNYQNTKIMELKYEDIIGNEVESFGKLFSHYEFHPKIIDRGLEIVEKLSLKNKKKSKTGHVRNGTTSQWAAEFSPLHEHVFNDLYGDLLATMGYKV